MHRFLMLAILVMVVAVQQGESKPDQIQDVWKHYISQERPLWPSLQTTSTARTNRPWYGSRVTPTANHVTDPVLTADSSNCGIDASTKTLIFNGNVTDVKQHPWLVQIEYLDRTAGRFVRICGGFLINHQFVLSAGHCFVDIGSLDPVNVILGEYDQSHEGPDCVDNDDGMKECTDGARSVPIADVKTHQNYRSTRTEIYNDISIVKMKSSVEYTRFIRPICLPSSDITVSPPSDLRFVVAGWGRTENSRYSNIKRDVEVPYVNSEKCSSVFYFKTKGHMCAGGEDGKDSCKGDSGGPLMYQREGVYTAVGMVSTGYNCGNVALYTNVFNYMSWINQNIGA